MRAARTGTRMPSASVKVSTIAAAPFAPTTSHSESPPAVAASAAHTPAERNPGSEPGPTTSLPSTATTAMQQPAERIAGAVSTPGPSNNDRPTAGNASPATRAKPIAPADSKTLPVLSPIAREAPAAPSTSTSAMTPAAIATPPPIAMTGNSSAAKPRTAPSSPRNNRRVSSGRQASLRSEIPVAIPSARSSKSAGGNWSLRGRR